MTPVISFTDVGKTFSSRGRTVEAVSRLTFSVFKGEYVCVLGRSGAGKSTAVNLLLGLSVPSQGTITVLEHDATQDFDALRGKIGCVFQADRLLPWRTAIDNVRLPLEIIGIDERRVPTSAASWLDRLGLGNFANAFPSELSGGMRQRIAVARALISDPDLVIADEPFASLDAVTGDDLRKEFYRLTKRSGKTVVHVTHSIDEALSLADRIIVLGKPGRVVRDLPIEQPLPDSSLAPLRSEVVNLLATTAAENPN